MISVPDVTLELEEFLCSPQNLPIHSFRQAQKFWPRKSNPDNLFKTELSPLHSYLKVTSSDSSSTPRCYEEERDSVGLTPKNSTSLQRAPLLSSDSVKGEPTSFPFWPGGIDVPVVDHLEEKTSDSQNQRLVHPKDFLTCPPGFSCGMKFVGTDAQSVGSDEVTDVLDISQVYFTDIQLDHTLSSQQETDTKVKPSNEKKEVFEDAEEDIDIGEIEQPVKPMMKTVPPSKWSVEVTEDVEDIPNMAMKYSFSLDVFQRQAIHFLEKHENVFVAAHTSAGKTVVAEYAIALSQRHHTRVIYTSPIKALSNQKFRDFRDKFGEDKVGLLTGDVQLKTEAPCLIMTTEILRSMLYNGSEVIRDVEWVVFDEIHYINDTERGVVWEEVVIMLPKHAGLIMLSATVPNAMKFADWVGRTKKKKIHVVSTLRRPVPLRHFLYTGHNKQTSNELFEIVSNKEIDLKSYRGAIQAIKNRSSKSNPQFGSKTKSYVNPKQEKNIWVSLIGKLQKDDNLPVVAFTFSRNRCDNNADSMTTTELLSSSEKSAVHVFFQKSVKRLKGTDSKLPQITRMRELLKRGVAVHHSGILPILKEVVELLFQKGLVKLLFATETFAMGVNMPARTVVFDSHQKHDGTRKRDLNPGEYIQMAGRAGRRGLDPSGTVILLCKMDVPEISDLKRMILGNPTSLESQFRLTYSMLLNLIRVDSLRVEDMMKRSFAEVDSAQEESDRLRRLEELSTRLADCEEVSCEYCSDSIRQLYEKCDRICQVQLKLKERLLLLPSVRKCLVPGRVVVLHLSHWHYSLALLLNTDTRNKTKPAMKALILCADPYQEETVARELIEESKKEMIEVGMFVPMEELYLPEPPIRHAVVDISEELIHSITRHQLSVNASTILKDYEKRQIPRFRDDPVQECCITAVLKLTELVKADSRGTGLILDPNKDLGVKDVNTVQLLGDLKELKTAVLEYRCNKCPQFEEHFAEEKKKCLLEKQIHQIKFGLSEKSLQFFPEYQMKVDVLKRLSLVNGGRVIQLKGRVACELHTQEVLITELLFQNVLSALKPSEIVALLSCVVFQQAKCSEPELTEELKQGKTEIIRVAKYVASIERECGLDITGEDAERELKFGLTEVVYHWAQGEEFVSVIKRTDVSEGMIVRCIQRLDETCKDVRNAARVIGDSVLYSKMQSASTLIRRDIVFAASLYIQ